MQALLISSPDQIQRLIHDSVEESVDKIASQLQSRLKAVIHHVDVKKAAFMEGVSVPMMRKIQSQYVTKLVGSKRVFRVENGELVRKSESLQTA